MNDITTAYFVRHAEPVVNIGNILYDPFTGLTKKGQTQAIRLLKELQEQSVFFDGLYVSRYPRAIMTAHPIVQSNMARISQLDEELNDLWGGKKLSREIDMSIKNSQLMVNIGNQEIPYSKYSMNDDIVSKFKTSLKFSDEEEDFEEDPAIPPSPEEMLFKFVVTKLHEHRGKTVCFIDHMSIGIAILALERNLQTWQEFKASSFTRAEVERLMPMERKASGWKLKIQGDLNLGFTVIEKEPFNPREFPVTEAEIQSFFPEGVIHFEHEFQGYHGKDMLNREPYQLSGSGETGIQQDPVEQAFQQFDSEMQTFLQSIDNPVVLQHTITAIHNAGKILDLFFREQVQRRLLNNMIRTKEKGTLDLGSNAKESMQILQMRIEDELESIVKELKTVRETRESNKSLSGYNEAYKFTLESISRLDDLLAKNEMRMNIYDLHAKILEHLDKTRHFNRESTLPLEGKSFNPEGS